MGSMRERYKTDKPLSFKGRGVSRKRKKPKRLPSDGDVGDAELLPAGSGMLPGRKKGRKPELY